MKHLCTSEISDEEVSGRIARTLVVIGLLLTVMPAGSLKKKQETMVH